MTPLQLTLKAPRAPRETLDGVIFLPRSIDKVRATLPGGATGAYRIAGLTQKMLDMLDVPLDAFTLAVTAADNDGEVAQFLRAQTTQAKLDEWNAFVRVRQPCDGNRTEMLAVFPWLADRPDMKLALDIIEEDDKQHFASPA